MELMADAIGNYYLLFKLDFEKVSEQRTIYSHYSPQQKMPKVQYIYTDFSDFSKTYYSIHRELLFVKLQRKIGITSNTSGIIKPM